MAELNLLWYSMVRTGLEEVMNEDILTNFDSE